SNGARIDGTNGTSNGPISFLKIFDEVAASFNQGGKRNGSIAAYMPIDHPDIVEFLKMRLPETSEATKARQLFKAVWISDEFMKRLEADADWSMFCPKDH